MQLFDFFQFVSVMGFQHGSVLPQADSVKRNDSLEGDQQDLVVPQKFLFVVFYGV
jgi:hypothetical protein